MAAAAVQIWLYSAAVGPGAASPTPLEGELRAGSLAAVVQNTSI
jgi:hypothetical protein